MPQLAANLTMLFTEQPFMERFKAAADAGFKAVEFLFPYAFDAEQIAGQLRAAKLRLVLHNLPAGNWEAGERGIACHPDRVAEFRAGVDEAIRYARALEAPQLNCLVGILPQGVAREAAREVLVGNLKYAAARLKEHGIRLLIEPINSFDIPGFFLTTTKQAVELILATGSDNLFVQYDIYHMQRMEGELAGTLKANLSLIGHVQLADNPGRFEPGTGEINCRYLFGWLDEIGYGGWIGCEYKPQAGTAQGLRWIKEHGL
ncbi:hydroxypyruvate isomerase [Herbaspirillum sp. WKF16]|uniref:hydroxypyruvate isomerase n=1 Tax=Herbaspirillum sp. WKF16 TaxID=3028312 RepID=UPI0023A935AC|nr:hydroxypyruvate isomerase [Herbaspirillum sp. WKF16]WDZ97519.1 hydroxypyruvate isomerase [Herbaspirillum sp. WKF16]